MLIKELINLAELIVNLKRLEWLMLKNNQLKELTETISSNLNFLVYGKTH